MTEGVSSRITRLNQLLSGKTSGRKVPLLDKETLLDAFVALFNECQTDYMQKDKNIATYVRKCKLTFHWIIILKVFFFVKVYVKVFENNDFSLAL